MRGQDRDQGFKKDISTPVQYLKGVGPLFAKILSKLGIHTIEDLIYYFPRDYEDRRNFDSIASLKTPSDKVLINGRIINIESQKKPGRMQILKITLNDSSGSIRIIFFNQPFLLKLFTQNTKLIVSGKLEFNQFEGCMQVLPHYWELDTGEPLSIVPVYNLTEGLFAKSIRKIIRTSLDQYLDQIKEPLPEEILKKNRLISILDAVQNLHFPQDLRIVEEAKRRMIFEDFLSFRSDWAVEKERLKL